MALPIKPENVERVTIAFPIHFLLGLYLCWLRVQSGSLLPGMLFHMLYNGALVCMFA